LDMGDKLFRLFAVIGFYAQGAFHCGTALVQDEMGHVGGTELYGVPTRFFMH
jgi:hypothetical protein